MDKNLWGGVPKDPPGLNRVKLPQKVTYRLKGNLSESPNLFKYRENILILRLYEQFFRNSRNLGHFGSLKKIYNLFCEIFKCPQDKSNNEFRKFQNAFVQPRNSNFSGNK